MLGEHTSTISHWELNLSSIISGFSGWEKDISDVTLTERYRLYEALHIKRKNVNEKKYSLVFKGN